MAGQDEYENIIKKSNFLQYDGDTSYLVLASYNCILKVHLPKVKLTDINQKIRQLYELLILDMNQLQSKIFSMIKTYHKQLSKVVLEFDHENILIN